jgi:hypothetical protein
MIRIVKDKIFIIENYLGADSCKFLTNAFHERMEETGRGGIVGGPSFSRSNYNKGLSSANDMFEYDQFERFNIGLDLMSGLGYRMQKTISDHYKNDYYVKSMFFSKMVEGGRNTLHMDNWYQTFDGKLKPRPFNRDDRSGLLYLNDDYEGGELYFPLQDFEYKPKAGTFIFFEGNQEVPHEVNLVKSGTRYNIISFYGDSSNFTVDTNPSIEALNVMETQATVDSLKNIKEIVWEYDDYGIN